MTLHFGIDVGGTKIEIVVLKSNFEILFRQRINTDSHLGSDHVFHNISLLYHNALSKFNYAPHTLGIGYPGVISKDSDILYSSTIYCHNGLNVKDELSIILNKDFVLDNDANCFTLAEANLGSAKNFDNIFGLILGTGCGGGIVINNKLYDGFNGFAGEIGHSIIDLNGNLCFCGNRGCANSYVSGTGLEEMILNITGHKQNARDFLNKKNYKPNELDILKTYKKYLSVVFLNIINIINPEVIVVGGGLSNSRFIYDECYQYVNSLKTIKDKNSTKIVKNNLGDSAGVIGAALIGI